MHISELIKSLQEIENKYGDCKIYYWDQFEIQHNPVNKVLYVNEFDLREDLSDDIDYMMDFERIKNNVIIE